MGYDFANAEKLSSKGICMATSLIATTLCAQFNRVWATFRETLTQLDAEQFAAGDIESLVPRNAAYHLVETADFYSSDCEPDDFSWGHVKAQDKDQILTYTKQVEAKVKQWLLKHNDEQFLAKQSVCKWTGASVLDRAMYALRHAQHHMGQIDSELRRRGLPCGEWQ